MPSLARSRSSLDRPLIGAFVVLLLIMAGLAVLPTAEAPGWGHRFMVYGRILDADGAPAQNVPVTIAVESVPTPYPQLTVYTDCHGLFYSQQDGFHEGDWNLFRDRIHIHHYPGFPSDYREDAEFIVATPYAEYRADRLEPETPLSPDVLDTFAVHRQPVDKELQMGVAHIRLDVSLEADPECEAQGLPDWRQTHVVVGKVQEIDGEFRTEMMSTPDNPVFVDVTVETTQGPRTQKVETDGAGVYIARFDNVTVDEGAPVTAMWEGHMQESEADAAFGVTHLDLVTGGDHGDDSLALWVFVALLGVAVIAGTGIAWDARRAKKDRQQDEDPTQDGAP